MEDKKVRIKLERHLWPDEIKEKRRNRVVGTVMVVSLMVVFVIGFLLGGTLQPQVVAQSQDSSAFSGGKLETIYNVMKNQWYFGSEDPDLEQHLIDNALYGMSSSEADRHTTYMSGEETKAFTESIDQNFVGVGIQYINADSTLIVTEVFIDSPAYQAGMLAGDIITGVNGESVEGLTSDEVSGRVRGEAGTDVTLQLLRGGQAIEKTMARNAVSATATGHMLTENIGLLNLSQFGSTTAVDCKKYLELMTNQGMDKLILDLRGNGGGYLDSALSIGSLFLPEGTVVLKEEYKDGTIEQHKASAGMFTNITGIVILIDKDTASASEMLTMALKEQRQDVTVVGTTSYGKGTVQTQRPFSDGSVLKYTVARWLSPNSVWINETGIKPDVELEAPEILNTSYYNMEESESYGLDQVSTNVGVAQKALQFLDYTVDRNDGYFDSSTQKSLQQFQSDSKMEVTGVMDKTTFEALVTTVLKVFSLDNTKDVQLQKAVELLNG